MSFILVHFPGGGICMFHKHSIVVFIFILLFFFFYCFAGCIFSNFTCSESDKTQIWGSTVRAVNDKIRKKRTKNH